jgi:hypothetical protein
MRPDGATEQLQVVAAFQNADHPSSAMLLRNPKNVFCHLCEIAVLEKQIPQRIVAV